MICTPITKGYEPTPKSEFNRSRKRNQHQKQKKQKKIKRILFLLFAFGYTADTEINGNYQPSRNRQNPLIADPYAYLLQKLRFLETKVL